MDKTNRELFFEYKNAYLINEDLLYKILIHVNEFKSFTDLIINFDQEIKDYNLFLDCIKRIQNGEPYQYVFGYTYFLDLKIKVNKNTLIPRSETEELCLKINELIDKYSLKISKIVDICTGSGCIALFMKKSHPNSLIFASDISKEALEVARKNSKNLNLDVNFLEGDTLKPFLKLNQKFDLLISNPPYVENIDDIEEIVKNNEPINAIYSENGTYFYEEIFKNCLKILNDQFILAFEINYDQENKLTELINKYFLNDIHYFFEKDQYGLTRFLFIIKG